MKKVFASDFDGTLYFGHKEEKISLKAVRKIKEYQAAGHLFGLCSGRQLGGLTLPLAGYVEPDFYITSSGSRILDGNLKEIARYGIDRQAADRIIKETDPQIRRILLHIEDGICAFEEIDFLEKCQIIDCVEHAPEGLIHQISIHAESSKEAAALAAHINKTYGNAVEAFQNVTEVDIAPKGCSKGKGLRILCSYLEEQWGPCRLYGIGDSMNDLPLIEASDVSYTFPYAPGQLQERATKVVKEISEALADSMAD